MPKLLLVRTALSKLKRLAATAAAAAVIKLPCPLDVQKRLLEAVPLDGPWARSLAYQQCLADRIIRARGNTIQQGPFKGMAYIKDAQEGCIVPKLLGCYEEELTPAIECLISRGFQRVINVGCASGYFAVGLALRLPSAEVFAFDIDKKAMARCAQLATVNHVQSHIKIGGWVTAADLQRLTTSSTLLMVDIDGGEYELLDPTIAPALRDCTIIVETHDCFNPQITAAMRSRFAPSHQIELVLSRERTQSSDFYPGLDVLPTEHWAAALAERRPAGNDWLVLTPRRSR